MQNLGKGVYVGAGGLAVLLALGGVSCRRATPAEQVAVDPGDEKDAAEKVKNADELYAQREDLAKARLAAAFLRQARTADYGSYEAAWKLARADYYLGAHTSDERERDDTFREGIDVGKIAVQLQGDRPDGHFWLGANYGGSAENSTLAGLANVEDIRREMEAVLKIDEGYQSGSAYLVLGQLYLQAPRALGGDYEKAIGFLEKGLRLGPNNTSIRLRLAEAYHATDRDAEARKQIAALVAATPDPNYLPEHKETVEKAKKLSEKLKGTVGSGR